MDQVDTKIINFNEIKTYFAMTKGSQKKDHIFFFIVFSLYIFLFMLIMIDKKILKLNILPCISAC